MRKPLRRAPFLAAVLVMTSVGFVLADTVRADGDSVTSGNQSLIPLGERGPGEVVTHDVTFMLECAGLTHPAPGSTITVQPSSFTSPLDGSLAATSTTIGPIPSTWTAGGEGCPTPAPTLPANGPSTVTLTTPTTPGEDYIFTVMYARVGASGISGSTAISFSVDVVANTPPTIALPASMTAEATSPAGAAVSFAVGATDAEDDPDPTPSCTAASGSIFALGTTTVSCSVTDSGGLSASGSFTVAVGDTTPPVLSGVPAGLRLTTSDPSGAPLAYALPTASDAADPSPTIGCDPAPGAIAPVGDSVVTCTATDDAGRTSSATFPVRVDLVEPTTWSVAWLEPIGGTPAVLVGNRGRTIPVKVEIFADGVEQTSGEAVLRLTPCGGGDAVTVPLARSSDRWGVNLDTSPLAAGCYVATASLDGVDAGSFRLELRGDEAAGAPAKEHAAPAPVKPTGKGPKK